MSLLHFSVYVKYSIILYFTHSNTHIFSHFSISETEISLNNEWHVRIQLAASTSFSVLHKIIVHLTIDGLKLKAMNYGTFC